jgi:gamma-glutamyltranspeptidase/glutathione hydrolase
MIASSQTAATQAGVEILKKGGSAVDAAIATNAVLSLTEPYMCGPGGDLFAFVWDPSARELVGLNASGRSALGVSYSAMREQLGAAITTMPGRGANAVTVPGAVDGWCALHERYGRLPFEEVFAPVVELAERGVPIGARTAQARYEASEGVINDPLSAPFSEAFRHIYLPDGRAPTAGEIFRNPDLGGTFAAIGRGGRGAFYGQDHASRLLECVHDAGGQLDGADLLNAHCDWVTPLSTEYRGYDVFELPPNGQGMSVLQMLNILEAYPLQEFGPMSADYWHTLIESKKLVFEDRARYYADPSFSDVPIAELTGKPYAEHRRRLIDSAKAGADYTHGDVAVPGSDTTYLCTADSDGMMVSLIQSIFAPFGSGLVPAGSGYALQCRGAGFSLDSDHPNCYAPGKRPFHTIIPAFVMQGGEPWLSFGVMGADMQPQGQVEVLVNMIDFGMDPQAAGDALRMRHFGGSQPNGAHLDGLGIVQFERDFPPDLIIELQRRGHKMQEIDDWINGFVGGYQAIQLDAETGVYCGASEPRLDGCALGY